jgi:hypothetical protein
MINIWLINYRVINILIDHVIIFQYSSNFSFDG